MKKRPDGFLSDDNLDPNSEISDYIQELHEYLWRFVRSNVPFANGKLDKYIDVAIEWAEYEADRKRDKILD